MNPLETREGIAMLDKIIVAFRCAALFIAALCVAVFLEI